MTREVHPSLKVIKGIRLNFCLTVGEDKHKVQVWGNFTTDGLTATMELVPLNSKQARTMKLEDISEEEA